MICTAERKAVFQNQLPSSQTYGKSDVLQTHWKSTFHAIRFCIGPLLRLLAATVLNSIGNLQCYKTCTRCDSVLHGSTDSSSSCEKNNHILEVVHILSSNFTSSLMDP